MSLHLEHITVAERVDLGCALLLCAGQYGVVTQVAQDLGTSRRFLYKVRETARTALVAALAPRRAGRPCPAQHLVVDRALLERSVVVLSQVAHASVRGIQECLVELLGVERSVGWIEGVEQEAARRAARLQAAPTQPLVAAVDEIFAADRPVLEVVDHASGLVLVLEPAVRRDATTWGCTLLDLQERGVTLDRVVADGAEGIRAGVAAAGLPAPRLDHFHTLRDLGRIGRQLERDAYRQLATAEGCQRAAADAAFVAQHGHRPRRGRPLHAASDPARVAAAVQAADSAIGRADDATWVLSVVRDVLRPVDPRTGQVRQAATVAAELTTAATLLREIGGAAATAATLLERRTPDLVAYLGDLEQRLASPRAVLDEGSLAFLVWAWQHRHALGLRDAADACPQDPVVAAQVWAALASAVRASSMVENLNSALAPHRAAHRGLPAPIVAVFQVYRNHHVLARGVRAEHSPLDLAGQPAPHWLDALGYGRTVPTHTVKFPLVPRHTVTQLAA